MRIPSTLKKTISILVIASFLCWVVWYIWNHQADFAVITRISLTHLVGLYVIYAIFLVCHGWLLKVALEAFGIEMDRACWLNLSSFPMIIIFKV
jgi:hypothetical protein